MSWFIIVYRQSDDRTSPVTPQALYPPSMGPDENLHAPKKEFRRLFDISSSYDLPSMLDRLVKKGEAICLAENNGYPLQYTVMAGLLMPIAKTDCKLSESECAVTAALASEEWLLVEAWDNS